MHIVTLGYTEFAFNSLERAVEFYKNVMCSAIVATKFEKKEDGTEDYTKPMYYKENPKVTLSFKDIEFSNEIDSDPF